MNLSEAITQYLQLRRAKYAVTTWRMDEVMLNRLLKECGDIPIEDVTPNHIQNLFYAPTVGLVHHMAGSTFNVNRSRLGKFCQWALDEGLLTVDPMRKVERRKELKRARRRLTGTEMAAVIDATDHPRDRILLALACNTGLRVRDILNLKVGNVDIDGGYLIATISKTQEQKMLPITMDLDCELRSWLAFYRYECEGLEPDWYLVPGRYDWGWVRDGEGAVSERGSSLRPDRPIGYPFRIIHAALAAVGADGDREGFHTLRRSAGRLVYEESIAAGDPRAIHVAQAFYGHAEARMTQHYIGTDEEHRKLDELLKGKPFLTGVGETK